MTASEWRQGIKGRWCETPSCLKMAANAHHIVKEQHLKRAGAPLYTPANRMALCHTCHMNYHSGALRIVLARDHPVRGFAEEWGLSWALERHYEEAA